MIRFGASTVDLPTRSVMHAGEPRHLEPQAFDLLVYLFTHRDRVVAKTELLDAVWGDQFVSESALTTRIKEVRRAVGDDGVRQEVIKNFRGRGYRFVAIVVDDADPDGPQARPLTTSLLGRDDDIAAVSRLLSESPLATLVGPGGVGKTSLARDLVARRRDLHADGATLIRLASVRDPEAVRHVLRRETGLEDAGPTDADLVAAIADLDALVVLDNCEHLIEEVARLADAITRQDGRVRLLATSRERLGLGAERVWPVEPLSAETARRLLEERAQSAQPGFELPPGSESRVMELLDRLDRLPLAIEMGAARLPSLGLDDLLDFLGDRLDLLRSADRSADRRHRTIGSLIAWSELLLEEQDREVLTALSTFAGRAVSSDVAAVVGLDATELLAGPLAALVDQSLVIADTADQPTTYRLLETVRATAATRRSPSHEASHANHMIDVATEMDRLLRSPAESKAAHRLDALDADLRLAHHWAREHDVSRAGELTASLLRYEYDRQWSEPASWARHLVEQLDPNDPAFMAAAASCAADDAKRGDFRSATSLAERASQSDDARVAASALLTLGDLGVYTGDIATALGYYASLREVGERADDATTRSMGSVSEAMAMTYGGRVDEALEHLLDGHEPALLSASASAWFDYADGEVLSALGRERDAIARFESAISTASAVGSRFVVSVAELSALAARTRVGDIDEARAAFVPVLANYRRTQSMTHAVTALRNLVELLVRARQDETAMTLLGALSNPDVKATYGAESDRLDAARDTVAGRVDDDVVAAWIAEGAVHDPLWAVDHAISALS